MSNTRKPASGASILKRIKPQLPETTVKVCLRPDLIDAHNQANERLQSARKSGSKSGRLASKTTDEERELAKRVRDIEDQLADATVEFRFRGMSPRTWQELLDEHPPRQDNQLDLMYGANRASHPRAAVRASIIEPEWDDDSWSELLDIVNSGQWEELTAAMRQVNRGVVDDAPFSELASLILTKDDGD